MTTFPWLVRDPPARRATAPAIPGALALSVTTSDGVVLAGLRCTGPRVRPGADGSPPPTVVVAHGFTHATGAPATRRVIALFARHLPVVALDFRGHGRSGGRSSVGRDETMDLDAAVRVARAWSGGPVAVVGFSLGGAVALRHAAAGVVRPDAVVTVSAPSRWYLRSTAPMRRVHWLLEHPAGPVVGRAMGVRLGAPWPSVPATPLELVGRIPPLPLLLVHGDADPYFGPAEASALHRASRGGGPLWIEPGMGHAETATRPQLVGRIVAWIREVTAPAG